MSEANLPPGKTTIAPDVLLNIATLTALSVNGVSRMSTVPGGGEPNLAGWTSK